MLLFTFKPFLSVCLATQVLPSCFVDNMRETLPDAVTLNPHLADQLRSACFCFDYLQRLVKMEAAMIPEDRV